MATHSSDCATPSRACSLQCTTTSTTNRRGERERKKGVETVIALLRERFALCSAVHEAIPCHRPLFLLLLLSLLLLSSFARFCAELFLLLLFYFPPCFKVRGFSSNVYYVLAHTTLSHNHIFLSSCRYSTSQQSDRYSTFFSDRNIYIQLACVAAY